MTEKQKYFLGIHLRRAQAAKPSTEDPAENMADRAMFAAGQPAGAGRDLRGNLLMLGRVR